MIQTIIVFIIVGIAAFFAIKRIYKMLSKNRNSPDCSSCCSSDSCDLPECK